MSEQETLDRLRDWDKAEMIYRDAYRMRHGQLSQEELEKQYADNPRILNYALYPDSFLDTLPEERVITEGRHTAVSKHPRYLTYLFHTHVFFEMTYVVEGTCTQFFDNASQEMKPGDFCILSPETRHYIYDFNEAIVVNILIRSSTFMDIFHGLMRQNTKISQFFAGNLYSRKKLRYMMFHAGDDAEIRRLILAMYDEEQRNDAYSDNIIVNLISIVFSQLLRRHSADMETPRLRRDGGDRTDELLNYIIEHYREVTLQDLADHFHFSRQYCSKLILELTGYSFSDLRTEIRVGQAEELLRTTTMSIEAVSEYLGYENPETFIRAFKRLRHMTPGAYRRQ